MFRTSRGLKLASLQRTVGTGWLPPYPDRRDYTTRHPEVAELTKKLGLPPLKAPALPKQVDLRQWCSEIANQGELNSCTAHALTGMVEYFENRAFGKHINGSRLFVYKTTRSLMQETGDCGAWLRCAMGALALCGVPDEKYWPYTDKKPNFDAEPPAFVYSVADNYEAVKYFGHDPLGGNIAPAAVLESVKKHLAAGIPSMFGFYVFPSYEQSDVPGGVPYPGPDESTEDGHAVLAVGYDNKVKIKNTQYGNATTGAFLFRNSWSADWGDKGYGWLPYQYVLDKFALDFWSLLSMAWVDSQQFGL
jgi:C1A family cysteine protease